MKKFAEGVEYRAEYNGEFSEKTTALIISRTDCYVTYEWQGWTGRRKIYVDNDVETVHQGPWLISAACPAEDMPEEPVKLCPVYDLFTGRRVS